MLIELVFEMLLRKTLLIFDIVSRNPFSIRHVGVLDVKEPINSTGPGEDDVAILFPHNNMVCAQLDAFRFRRDTEDTTCDPVSVYTWLEVCIAKYMRNEQKFL